MFVLTNIFEAIISILDLLLSAYTFVVIAACLISFVNPDPYNPIVRLLRNLTEPVLWRIRKLMPFVHRGGIDFSPLVLLLIIQLTRMIVIRSLYQVLALTL